MKYILAGFQKCGNSWARFVLFNYWNILENQATETLTYRELIRINEDIWEGKGSQYPQIYFTHISKGGETLFGYDRWGKARIYRKEHKLIYPTRNPFDCMVSYFNYMINREEPFNGRFKGKDLEAISTLEGFTKSFLPRYIHHVKLMKPIADVVLDYDVLRKDPSGFYPAVKLVFGVVDNDIFSQAVEMSSFEKIKQMGIKKQQQHGLASTYKGHFTRDGRTGQYKEVMSKELIEYIKNECEKEGLKIW